MKVTYFDDSDTLYIEFKQSEAAETRDLDENTLLDLDEQGQVIAITVEHASQKTDVSKLILSGIAA